MATVCRYIFREQTHNYVTNSQMGLLVFRQVLPTLETSQVEYMKKWVGSKYPPGSPSLAINQLSIPMGPRPQYKATT